MSGIEAIAPLGIAAGPDQISGRAIGNAQPERAGPVDFGSLLAAGIGSVDAKVARADTLVAQFALDDSIPVHQVTVALEEARLSLEFAMQVRSRLVEAYKELMNMQI